MVRFRTWISLSDDDSWKARQDKVERLAAFPAPLFVLSGPGATSGRRFFG